MTGASVFDVLILLAAVGSLLASALLGQIGALRRALSVVAVLFGATLVVSGMLRIVPGDPVEAILGDRAPQEARARLSRDLGLTDDEGRPVGFVAQYGAFVQGTSAGAFLTLVPDAQLDSARAAKGDAGAWTSLLKTALDVELKSYRTRRPVREVLAARLPYTAILALSAMLIAIFLGVLLGVFAAWRRGTWVDATAMGFAVLGVALPRPALGPYLLLIFVIGLGWFPISGAESPASIVLPALSLGTALAAVLARLTRASLLEVLHQDYVRTARAKGLSEKVVVLKHALRNALIPVLTVVGLQLGAVLAGAVITEKIFVWPGIGLLLFESILRLDVPVVQGCVLTIASAFVFANLLTDIAYGAADPRIRLEGDSR